ncbi:MAG TPA: hypothetical protein VLH40_05180, partial [Atribacteraceae bacterium]|nr:hypothetical protein [Atribacteraceae bacterium]
MKCATFRLSGGCFAIALTGSAHAPPIKAIEPTPLLSLSDRCRALLNLRCSRLIRRCWLTVFSALSEIFEDVYA